MTRGDSGAAAERFAAIVESSDDAILSKDVEGIITSWNPAAERIYGYTEAEAIGQPISILIPRHRAGEERRILDRVLAGERLEHYETERVTKDGRHDRASRSPSRRSTTPTASVVGASVIARDITDRHRSLQLDLAPAGADHRALAGDHPRAHDRGRCSSRPSPALGADAGAVGLLDRGSQEVGARSGTIGYSESGARGWERFPLAAETPMSIAIQRDESVWTMSPGELASRYPAVGATERFSAAGDDPAGGRRESRSAPSR